MAKTSKAEFGMIGMAVMGKNLALNILDHGYSVAVHNRELDAMAEAVQGTALQPNDTLQELVASLERPRRIMMLIRAGEPVDMVMKELRPLLEPGDILIDGGNSWFEDTRRREKDYAAASLNFVGVGVSGGADGARHGPSLMPGGSREAYERLEPVFRAVAAKTDSGACVTYIGPDGAGHFVKMVHNGIEYADMQCIAEAYDLLRRLGGIEPPRLAEIFDEWNRGPLESFLIEITAKIFTVQDPAGSGFLVDQVLDQAGQKGTGRWTARVALDLGVAVPSIAAAIDARVLSAARGERLIAAKALAGPVAHPRGDERELVRAVHDALHASKLCAYAQGMALIAAGSRAYGWRIDLKEVARIWKGGCIIRARLLDEIMKAYEMAPDLPNLLLNQQFRDAIGAAQEPWRRVVSLAISAGVPAPAMSASIAYYDSYRAASLPANLTQAQRDAFGSHTYQRRDAPEAGLVHTDWLAGGCSA